MDEPDTTWLLLDKPVKKRNVSEELESVGTCTRASYNNLPPPTIIVCTLIRSLISDALEFALDADDNWIIPGALGNPGDEVTVPLFAICAYKSPTVVDVAPIPVVINSLLLLHPL